MPLKYHLVLRADKRKDAAPGAQLYYGQVRSERTITFPLLCDLISDNSTASSGDVKIVIDGLVRVMQRSMGFGDVIQVGDLGNLRMVAGSSGVATQEDFAPTLFKKGHIVFTPGASLRKLETEIKFEKGKFGNNETGGSTDGGDTGGGDGPIEEL